MAQTKGRLYYMPSSWQSQAMGDEDDILDVMAMLGAYQKYL